MGGHGWPWAAMGGHGRPWAAWPLGYLKWPSGHGRPSSHGRPWPAIRLWPLFNEMAAFLKKKKAATRPRTVNFSKAAMWPDGRMAVGLPPKIGKILNNGLQGVKMGTKMLRGQSLKSLSLLRTFYLPQIMILPDSELKLSK